MARRRPHVALWPHVREYVGWFEHMRSPLCRRELPADEVPVIISFGVPIRVYDVGDSDRFIDLGSFATGAYDSYVRVLSAGLNGGVQINFSILGARLFLARPLEPLRNRSVPLEDLFGSEADRLTARLHDAPSWSARFDILDREIGRRICAARPPSVEIVQAWTRIVDSGGRIGIRRLVDEAGWSQKHFIARFKEEIGLGPKTMARVLRFARAANQLRRATAPSLADIALECGYYDQAHFTKDFRSFAGVAPRELLSRVLPDSGGIAV